MTAHLPLRVESASTEAPSWSSWREKRGKGKGPGGFDSFCGGGKGGMAGLLLATRPHLFRNVEQLGSGNGKKKEGGVAVRREEQERGKKKQGKRHGLANSNKRTSTTLDTR